MTNLSTLVDNSSAMLLDFDGPVCSVFAGYPAETVASELRQFLASQYVAVPGDAAGIGDPLKVLRWVGEHHPALVGALDELLTAAEVTAVQTAKPTSHSGDVIMAASRTGRRVVIVSNNGEPAITRYLAAHGLSPLVTLVIGRTHANPLLMKPHPDAVLRAVEGIGKHPGDCLLVGDSPADIEASRAVGVHPIGYAKTPSRRPRLVTAGAEVVIEDLGELATALDSA